MSIIFQQRCSQLTAVRVFVVWLVVCIQHPVYANSSDFEQSRNIVDPIFSVEYDSNHVHFEMIETASVLPTCRKNLLEFKPLPKKMLLYAKYVSGQKYIYIIGTHTNSIIVVLNKGTCDSGTPLFSLNHSHYQPPEPFDSPVLTDAEVEKLFTDALDRHAKAFGGKELFLKWLDTKTEAMRSGCVAQHIPDQECVATYHTFQPLLKKALMDYWQTQ